MRTRQFGTIEVEEEKVISFPQGIMGFSHAKSFCLINQPDLAPYVWLQSLDQPELAFLTIPLQLLRPDYHLALRPEERELLQSAPDAWPLVLGIVHVPENPKAATVNLLAPLVINDDSRVGRQIVNEQEGYKTKHLIKEEQPHAKEGESHVGADPKKTAVARAR